jgi:light-regulated signal transduction histidine kinase (bacteriophytochrome)
MKRAELALQWANADLEQFAFSASHDLREPIRNIAIHSELIAHRFGHLVDADGRRSLQYVIQGARRLDTLVSDLLKYTTISKVEDPVETVDSEVSLESSLETMATLIRESGAEVTHGPLPKLRIREVHLQQLFQNLLGNAIKYRGAAAPRIHINAVRTDHFWQVAVADNGIGIEPRHQQSIFGLFKRLHRAEKYAGTGLGLAICQRIIHLYGGQIWVESAGGNGATFLFTLPGAEDSIPSHRTVA